MTFQMIPNPLGSGGYNVQPLPDMTGGIQALQKVEIQRRINEIEKEKDYKNNVNLLMEKKALDLLMPKAYEGIAGDRLIVGRVRRYLSPQVAPDYINERLIWTVEGMTGGSPSEYRSYEMSGSFRAKWAWRSIGGINDTLS